ncbi:hypothetical protein RFI_06771 [Reticulomyxa filosa]|uniref:Uncharacterized protein n=1 Tax=Reticulomyxa filosa TaxID=46433 RepID=X6NWV3_RETFI|nr:hypothetical protein RFI_06771 [Reticulomyxa filosa]|eukprot:ETO30353.1 hypothetical protein RFI_06771 [Reticulomyxa filosa]
MFQHKKMKAMKVLFNVTTALRISSLSLIHVSFLLENHSYTKKYKTFFLSNKELLKKKKLVRVRLNRLILRYCYLHFFFVNLLAIIKSVDISPLQSNHDNDNNNKINNISIIGGNGYKICSGSWDKTIRIWDIETTKQFNVFEGHESYVCSVKYGSNELMNTILSGSSDDNVRLWDIRCGKQVQKFNGHKNEVYSVEYSPFVIKNSIGNSNVICSGSIDNTIRFWDIRSNKEEFYIKGNDDEEDGISCLKFVSLRKKVNDNKQKPNDCYCVHLYYSSVKSQICVWG